MAIDDNTNYTLTGAQVKQIPQEINKAKGQSITLTPADYNYPVNNPDGVAMWKVPSGVYTNTSGTKVYLATGSVTSTPVSMVVAHGQNGGNTSIMYSETRGGSTDYPLAGKLVGSSGSEVQNLRPIDTGKISNSLTVTNSGYVLDARQGKTLNDRIGDLSTLTTTDKTSAVAAINEIAAGGGGPTVVQTTGTSTTDVMSQNAVSSMVYADPSAKQKIQMGQSASVGGAGSVGIGAGGVNCNGAYSTALGWAATSSSRDSVALGSGATNTTNAEFSVAAGNNSKTEAAYSVALGSYSKATVKGQVDISTLKNTNTYGYNDSQYRLLTGLYDPQNAHDAATKGYVDAHAGGPTVVQTTGASTTDVMSQNAVTTELASKAGTAVATTNTNGLMSSTDKSKLNSLDSMFMGTGISNDPYAVKVYDSDQSSDTRYSYVRTTGYSSVTGVYVGGIAIEPDATWRAEARLALYSDLSSYVTSSDLSTTLGDYATTASLATVATTGDYTDLSNTPTIPTVGDATITLTNNGATVGSFTANESSNQTINFTAPVITMQASDPGEGVALAANNFIAVYNA